MLDCVLYSQMGKIYLFIFGSQEIEFVLLLD